MGLGLSLSSPRLRYTCVLCRQEIPSNESRRTLRSQLLALKIQEDAYSKCLVCGQGVARLLKRYKARVEKQLILIEEERKRVNKLVQNRCWLESTKSLVGQRFCGHCPECRVEMIANIGDAWECEICRIEIIVSGDEALIRRFKGMKDFKEFPHGKMSAVDGLGLRTATITIDARTPKGREGLDQDTIESLSISLTVDGLRRLVEPSEL